MSILTKVKEKVKNAVIGKADFITVAIPSAKAKAFYEADIASKEAKIKRDELHKNIIAFLTEKKADKGLSAYTTFTKCFPKAKPVFKEEAFKEAYPDLYKKFTKIETGNPYYKATVFTK